MSTKRGESDLVRMTNVLCPCVVEPNRQMATDMRLTFHGNKIEEKYIGEKLIERKINGMVEEIGRIANDERQQNGEEF